MGLERSAFSTSMGSFLYMLMLVSFTKKKRKRKKKKDIWRCLLVLPTSSNEAHHFIQPMKLNLRTLCLFLLML